jgi:polyisoprenoid-binding protein YceI
MKFRILTAAALLLGAASLASATDAYTIDGRHSEATFRVRHLMTKVSGKFADIAGVVNIDKANPAASTVDFTIKTATIDTGVADRDKHLRSTDFFDTDKFPEITFKSTKIVPAGKKDVYNVTGNFTMHGVTKELTLPVEVLGWQSSKQGERVGFSLATTINRKDYGINWNRVLDQGALYLGEDVDVNVSVEAVKRAEAPAAPAAAKQ